MQEQFRRRLQALNLIHILFLNNVQTAGGVYVTIIIPLFSSLELAIVSLAHCLNTY